MTTRQKIKILHEAAERIELNKNELSCIAIYDASYFVLQTYILEDLREPYSDFSAPEVGAPRWEKLYSLAHRRPNEARSLRVLLLLNFAEALRVGATT